MKSSATATWWWWRCRTILSFFYHFYSSWSVQQSLSDNKWRFPLLAMLTKVDLMMMSMAVKENRSRKGQKSEKNLELKWDQASGIDKKNENWTLASQQDRNYDKMLAINSPLPLAYAAIYAPSTKIFLSLTNLGAQHKQKVCHCQWKHFNILYKKTTRICRRLRFSIEILDPQIKQGKGFFFFCSSQLPGQRRRQQNQITLHLMDLSSLRPTNQHISHANSLDI